MRPAEVFLGHPMVFWANVRSISQEVGYTKRGTGQIKVPGKFEICRALSDLGLSSAHLYDERTSRATEFGRLLEDYFEYRAEVLNNHVEAMLMDAAEARERFERLQRRLRSTRRLVMNKQTGTKAGPQLLTNTVNLIVESLIGGLTCDYDPSALTTFTRNGVPVRTLARRVDGAFPSTVNPVAIWEIKEYYYTTTFGSRVADGVYETLLDGLELEELRKEEGIDCKHYLFVDSHFTWWVKGRSYLCRIIDMLHMGYVDEVLFGREVEAELPRLVSEWARDAACS